MASPLVLVPRDSDKLKTTRYLHNVSMMASPLVLEPRDSDKLKTTRYLHNGNYKISLYGTWSHTQIQINLRQLALHNVRDNRITQRCSLTTRYLHNVSMMASPLVLVPRDSDKLKTTRYLHNVSMMASPLVLVPRDSDKLKTTRYLHNGNYKISLYGTWSHTQLKPQAENLHEHYGELIILNRFNIILMYATTYKGLDVIDNSVTIFTRLQNLTLNDIDKTVFNSQDEYANVRLVWSVTQIVTVMFSNKATMHGAQNLSGNLGPTGAISE
ncbi:hypothetical protein J6590_070880 [Homalodisca vitripennis]|nr:hypothetical protein J6590_070880 [Homalodisca vitripennis]